MLTFLIKISRSICVLATITCWFFVRGKAEYRFGLQGLTSQERKRVSSCFKLGNMPKIVRNWFMFLFLSKLLTVNVSCHRLTCSILQLFLASFWYHFSVSSLLCTYLPSQVWSDPKSFDSGCPMSMDMRCQDNRSQKEARTSLQSWTNQVAFFVSFFVET